MSDKLYYTLIAVIAVVVLLIFSVGVYVALTINSLTFLLLTIMLIGALMLGLLHAYDIYLENEKDS